MASCTLEPSSKHLGDQCPGTSKYLQVDYQCIQFTWAQSWSINICDKVNYFYLCRWSLHSFFVITFSELDEFTIEARWHASLVPIVACHLIMLLDYQYMYHYRYIKQYSTYSSLEIRMKLTTFVTMFAKLLLTTFWRMLLYKVCSVLIQCCWKQSQKL